MAFPKQDHERLFECLKNLKGKFVLSYNNCEYIRDLYKQYNIIEASRHSSFVGSISRKRTEISGVNHKELLGKQKT